MRVGTRLALFFIFLTAAFIGLVGYLFSESAAAAISDRTADQLASISLLKKSQLDDHNADQLVRMGMLSSELGEEMGEDEQAAHNQSQAGILRERMVELRAGLPEFDRLFVMDLNGTVVASTDATQEGRSAANESYFIVGKTTAIRQARFYPPETGLPPSYIMAMPLRDEGGMVAAVLGGQISFRKTDELMAGQAGLGTTGEVFLVDRYGVPVTALKKTRTEPDSPLHTWAVEQCIAGVNGSGRYQDYHGDEVIETYTWFPDMQVCMISKIDASEALVPIRDIDGRMAAISAMLFVFAFIIIIVMLGRLLAPIEELTRVISAISKGEIGVELDPRMKESQDEIGKLARAFDRTLVSLKLAMRETAPQLKLESRALRESLAERTRAEARYRALIQTSPDAVAATDLKGNLTEVSQRTVALHGYANAAELMGRSAFDMIAPRDRQRAMENMARVAREGVVEGVRYAMLRKDGTEFIGELNSRQVKDVDGKPAGFIATVRDVTKREADEKALQEALRRERKAEEKLGGERDLARKYLGLADFIMIAIGADQKVTFINRKGCEVLGYREDEILGRNWFDSFIPAKGRKRVREVFGKLMAGEMAEAGYYENEVLAKGGRSRLVRWHNTILRDDGHIIGTLSSGEDITARKNALKKRTGNR